MITKSYLLKEWEYTFFAKDGWIVMAHTKDNFESELKRWGYWQEYNIGNIDEKVIECENYNVGDQMSIFDIEV